MAVKIKPQNLSRTRSRMMGIIVALAVIVIVAVISIMSSMEMRKTVTVVRVKPNQPIAANALITEDKIEAYNMYYKEFEQYGTMQFSDGSVRSTLVRWNDKDAIVGKRYAAYYLRGGTALFWDSTLADQTRKNSYLYNMSGELLNINMNTVTDFGDMVVPGDTLNVRATYTAQDFSLPTDSEYANALDAGNTGITATEKTVVEPLFNEVQILDMLNSNGQSIFDIYYQYIAMTKEEQATALQDDAFLDSVKPSSILLECTAEEVEHYMEMQSKGATYQITLLPRKSSSAMTDSLSEIQEALSGIAGLTEGE